VLWDHLILLFIYFQRSVCLEDIWRQWFDTNTWNFYNLVFDIKKKFSCHSQNHFLFWYICWIWFIINKNIDIQCERYRLLRASGYFKRSVCLEDIWRQCCVMGSFNIIVYLFSEICLFRRYLTTMLYYGII
jgi:hypothetical protein